MAATILHRILEAEHGILIVINTIFYGKFFVRLSKEEQRTRLSSLCPTSGSDPRALGKVKERVAQ